MCVQLLKEEQMPDGVVKVVKMLGSLPSNWVSCIQLGRIKFEKYFNHKVMYSSRKAASLSFLILCRL